MGVDVTYHREIRKKKKAAIALPYPQIRFIPQSQCNLWLHNQKFQLLTSTDYNHGLKFSVQHGGVSVHNCRCMVGGSWRYKTCREMGCCYSCYKDDSAQVVTTTRMPMELLILNAFETVLGFNYHRHKASHQCQELVI